MISWQDMWTWLKDVCRITQTDAHATEKGAAIPTNEFPAHTPQLIIHPKSLLGGNWLFQKQGE